MFSLPQFIADYHPIRHLRAHRAGRLAGLTWNPKSYLLSLVGQLFPAAHLISTSRRGQLLFFEPMSQTSRMPQKPRPLGGEYQKYSVAFQLRRMGWGEQASPPFHTIGSRPRRTGGEISLLIRPRESSLYPASAAASRPERVRSRPKKQVFFSYS